MFCYMFAVESQNSLKTVKEFGRARLGALYLMIPCLMFALYTHTANATARVKTLERAKTTTNVQAKSQATTNTKTAAQAKVATRAKKKHHQQ